MDAVICSSQRCGREATKQLHVAIVAPGSDVVAPGRYSLFACERCATQESADAIFDSEESRVRFRSAFRTMGRAEPDWARSHARWGIIDAPTVSSDHGVPNA